MRSETGANGITYLYPTEADDVTPQMLELAEQVFDGFFADESHIDWDEFLDRMAKYSLIEDAPWEFDETHNAAVRKIKRHIRQYRAES